jgi:hypothetical protein
LFDHYKKLIAIRQHLPALQTGFPHVVLADDAHGVIAIGRDLHDQHAVVVLNRSAESQTIAVPIGPADKEAAVINWLDDAATTMDTDATDDRPTIAAKAGNLKTHDGTCTISLPAWGSAVLTTESP